MDTITALTTRVSSPRLDQPGPSDEQLDLLLRAAIRAPDHGLLRPWRFIVLEGEQRERLGDIMEAQLLEEQPEADKRSREIARNKALRASFGIKFMSFIYPLSYLFINGSLS